MATERSVDSGGQFSILGQFRFIGGCSVLYSLYTADWTLLQTGHCCRLDTEREEVNSRVETASFGLTWLYVFFMGESESGIVGSSLDQPNRYIV